MCLYGFVLQCLLREGHIHLALNYVSLDTAVLSLSALHKSFLFLAEFLFYRNISFSHVCAEMLWRCVIMYVTDVHAVSRCVWFHAWEHVVVISVCCCIKPYGCTGMASVLYYYQFTCNLLWWLSWDARMFAQCVLLLLFHIYYHTGPWFPAAAYMCMTMLHVTDFCHRMFIWYDHLIISLVMCQCIWMEYILK